LQVAIGIEAGGGRPFEPRQQGRCITAVSDEVADDPGFRAIEHDKVSAVWILESLRGGCARLFVLHFSVNDRGEPVLRVPHHVLPDVQHRTTRRVDERASLV
jgi:hypothetical protein